MWAFETVISMSRRVDSLTVVFCYDNGCEAKHLEMKKTYDDVFETNGFDPKLVRFAGVEKTGGVPVHGALADFIGEEQPTFTVVAPDVNLERAELSVSEHIIKAVKSNIIVLKIPKDLR